MKFSESLALCCALILPVCVLAEDLDYQRARFDPIHFSPAIDTAEDSQCLACHREVLEPSVRDQSLAGLSAMDAKAWYQYLDTYEGPQETFHRRHLVTSYANQVMQMRCNTCHRGNEPRDEMQGTPPKNNSGYTLRKMVDPLICSQCHSQLDYKIMGLPTPWEESKALFGNSCLTCHVAIRTNRHQVNYLKPEAIERLAQEKGADVCLGCHGGRAWYRTSFNYPRHAWPGMPKDLPDWAKGKPTESPEYVRKDKK